LQSWPTLPEGTGAAIIGSIDKRHKQVLMKTALGGERILEELEDDPLPRIC
jgi:hydrogenase expression/formation protein HypE